MTYQRKEVLEKNTGKDFFNKIHARVKSVGITIDEVVPLAWKKKVMNSSSQSEH